MRKYINKLVPNIHNFAYEVFMVFFILAVLRWIIESQIDVLTGLLSSLIAVVIVRVIYVMRDDNKKSCDEIDRKAVVEYRYFDPIVDLRSDALKAQEEDKQRVDKSKNRVHKSTEDHLLDSFDDTPSSSSSNISSGSSRSDTYGYGGSYSGGGSSSSWDSGSSSSSSESCGSSSSSGD